MPSVSPVTAPTMYCRACGYVLNGLPENRCPECSLSFDPLDQANFLPHPLPLIPPWVRILGVVLAVPMFGIVILVTRGWAVLLCPLLILVSAEIQRDKQNRRLLLRPVTVAATAVLIAEVFCLWLVYYTLGELLQFMYLIVCAINAVPCGLWVSGHRRPAMLLLMLVALPLLIPQTILGVRLWRLHREVNQIVAYVEAIKNKEGRPPRDLSGYTYSSPSLRGHIRYSTEEDHGRYDITYWVVQPGISYWYDAATGWGYYPD